MTEPNPYRGMTPVDAFPFGPTTASVQVVNRQCVILGFGIRETTGAAAASVDVVDGADDNAPVLIPIDLTAGQSARDAFSTWGIMAQRGARIKVRSGSVSGALFLMPL